MSSEYPFILLFISFTIISFKIIVTSTQNAEVSYETCSTQELYHSVLVECNSTSCGPAEVDGKLWPESRDQILHIVTTRDGARLSQNYLPNLDYEEDANTELLDINTTLTVFTKPSISASNKANQRIIGFGATLNFSSILFEKHFNLEKSYGLILDDLLGELPHSAHLNILRLIIENPTIVCISNLKKLIQDIDQHIAHVRNYNQQNALKIVLDLRISSGRQQQPGGVTILRHSDFALELANGLMDKLSSVELWALALDHEFFESMIAGKNIDQYNSIKIYLPSINLMASVPMVEAAYFVERLNKSETIAGILLEGQPAVPYNILEYLSSKGNFKIMTSAGTARPKTRDYGDWINAQEYSIEILKHLRHGSMGFIESVSVTDVLSKKAPHVDSSLYNLHMSHQVHFKGPMFYATSHFSRYIPPDSEILDNNLFTQPNMFSAHYTAFRTPNNHVVAIVLNSNDHLLPFRLKLDNKIVAHTNLDAKSFNTIIVKL